MGVMNIVNIIAGTVFITIAVLSVFASFRRLKYLDRDIFVISAAMLMYGVAAILMGILFK